MNLNTLLISSLLIFFISCTSAKDKDIPTYTVSYSNFENSITLDGLVEPIKISAVICPLNVEGIITYLVEDGTYVHAGDIICKIEFQELQVEYENMLIELEDAKAVLSKTKADLDLQYALLEAQVETNDANTKIAQLDSLQLIYSPANLRKIKELELEKAAIQKKQYDAKLQALNVINQTEIRRRELRIQRVESRVESLKKRLDELNIKAPKDGIVIVSINRATDVKHKIGSIVWSNMPIASIPELSEMKVIIKASETDFKYINANDSVVYTFDAMPENKAWGKIQMKSPVGSPYKRGSKVKFFEIIATIDSALSMPAPGYTANCHVIVKEIKDTLVIPQVAVFEEDSVKIVYVKNKNRFEMRQILTGLSSPKEVVVTAGLKENDAVALTKPDHSLILPSSLKGE
jgi:multidrug efflux pump subunit AcrA (membrane-fusion protein)